MLGSSWRAFLDEASPGDGEGASLFLTVERGGVGLGLRLVRASGFEGVPIGAELEEPGSPLMGYEMDCMEWMLNTASLGSFPRPIWARCDV